MAAILEGIKALDLTRVIAGPLCTQILADMGATVYKIEKPGEGDDTRRMGPFLPDDQGTDSNDSALYLAYKRGKQSVTMRQQRAAGRQRGPAACAAGAGTGRPAADRAARRPRGGRRALRAINDMRGVFEDPQTRHRLPHSRGVDVPSLRSPLRFSGTPVVHRASPMLGEHSAQVLAAELGLDAERLQTLRERAIV
jgi:crotonobetainyl-CoA:carnitine CoA-transferase CaiB-like acyl-CoA transferase